MIDVDQCGRRRERIRADSNNSATPSCVLSKDSHLLPAPVRRRHCALLDLDCLCESHGTTLRVVAAQVVLAWIREVAIALLWGLASKHETYS